jgi:4-amino-4-deoxychorismate lyase
MSGMSGMSGAGSESSVPVSDRGLQYGDGLFETIACRDGRPRFLARHFERLMSGCARLGIPPPSRVELEAAVAAAAARAAAPRSLVKVLLTRGSGPTRGYAPPLAPEPRCIVEGFAWPPEPLDAPLRGIALTISDVPATENRLLAGIKHLNRLDSVLARARLAGTGFEESLLCAADGSIVGGSMSNFFAMLGGRLVTPVLDRAGIAGILRGLVLREARQAGWEVEERVLWPAELAAADEMFVSNVRIGLWPVVRLDSRSLGVGERTRFLQRSIEALSD